MKTHSFTKAILLTTCFLISREVSANDPFEEDKRTSSLSNNPVITTALADRDNALTEFLKHAHDFFQYVERDAFDKKTNAIIQTAEQASLIRWLSIFRTMYETAKARQPLVTDHSALEWDPLAREM